MKTCHWLEHPVPLPISSINNLGTTYSWILSGQHISHRSAFGKRGGHSLLWFLGVLIWGKWSWYGKHWSRYRLWLKSFLRWMAGCVRKGGLASTVLLVVYIIVIKIFCTVRGIRFWFYIEYNHLINQFCTSIQCSPNILFINSMRFQICRKLERIVWCSSVGRTDFES